jgi:hypothetical protein
MDKKSVKLAGLITKLTLAANRAAKKKKEDEKRTSDHVIQEPLNAFHSARKESRIKSVRLMD